MKGTYRLWVRRDWNPEDWELVGGYLTADEGHAAALGWEQNPLIVEVRLDVCVRFFARESVSLSESASKDGES